MIVVEHGCKYKEKKFVCNECGCVFIASDKEYRFLSWHDSSFSENKFVCECPECGEDAFISDKED